MAKLRPSPKNHQIFGLKKRTDLQISAKSVRYTSHSAALIYNLVQFKSLLSSDLIKIFKTSSTNRFLSVLKSIFHHTEVTKHLSYKETYHRNLYLLQFTILRYWSKTNSLFLCFPVTSKRIESSLIFFTSSFAAL